MKAFDLEQVDRLLTTTPSAGLLHLERPVERSVITECIALAVYAPNASNAHSRSILRR